jgi:hypothetical protein
VTRLLSSRRPWRRVAVLALVAALIAAIATPAYWTMLASPERLRWTLVGAGADGRSIVITTTAEGGTCGDDDLPHARLERDGAEEIRIRVVQHRPVQLRDALHPLEGYMCAGVGLGRSTFEVRLQHPVNGRRISGPGYRPKLATRVGIWSTDYGSRRTMGRVVGLRVQDARRVLRSYGIMRPAVQARGATAQW